MICFRYSPKCEYLYCPCNFNNRCNINKEYRNDEGVELQQQKLMPNKFCMLYPFIPNENNKENFTKINNGIINEVSELFKRQVIKPEVLDFNEILETYEVKLNERKILSILFSMYTYINKAAHGYTAYSSITVNVETGQIYNFSDLFNGKVCYIITLNELSKQYIKDNNINLINEYKGITEDQQYYLTPTSLVLYYQVYEYTPYYYGLFKIEIPYEKLKNIQIPGGPISKFL